MRIAIVCTSLVILGMKPSNVADHAPAGEPIKTVMSVAERIAANFDQVIVCDRSRTARQLRQAIEATIASGAADIPETLAKHVARMVDQPVNGLDLKRIGDDKELMEVAEALKAIEQPSRESRPSS